MVLLHQELFFLAPDFSLVSGAYDSQRLLLPLKSEEKKAPSTLLFSILFVSSSSSLCSTGARFSLAFPLLFMYSHNPFFLSFLSLCHIKFQVSLGFPNPIPACSDNTQSSPLMLLPGTVLIPQAPNTLVALHYLLSSFLMFLFY